MKKYNSLYSWEVISSIDKGKKVYCLDRETLDTCLVNNMPIESVFALIKESETEKTRFVFWYEEEVEEQEDNE